MGVKELALPSDCVINGEVGRILGVPCGLWLSQGHLMGTASSSKCHPNVLSYLLVIWKLLGWINDLGHNSCILVDGCTEGCS